jgi:hypothetical protein
MDMQPIESPRERILTPKGPINTVMLRYEPSIQGCYGCFPSNRAFNERKRVKRGPQ